MKDTEKVEFYEQAFIPKYISLEFEKFDEFYEKRKAILTDKLRELLG